VPGGSWDATWSRSRRVSRSTFRAPLAEGSAKPRRAARRLRRRPPCSHRGRRRSGADEPTSTSGSATGPTWHQRSTWSMAGRRRRARTGRPDGPGRRQPGHLQVPAPASRTPEAEITGQRRGDRRRGRSRLRYGASGPNDAWPPIESGSSLGRRSGVAPSPRSRTSSPPSRPSSTAGMSAANRSSGPRPPTNSSPRQRRSTDFNSAT